ncbi:hypothetical protein PPYR_13712 [Photinus pyralis]|uniref:Mediator of RNA polymerase II transcription subunit 13 n=1 Tax=Photinus pyralis TaxID=7054 RepID=A0A5N4A9U5_PHOPY|nr:mediator of RNA polymerase II transcription subunit 13-like isoform X1 [Photinus pyralis]KAB0794092.1 hypothetical protein PPYR_13712 [Photinus pyralis]
MTHPNFQTNGASLEDCHTNFFALTELSGIKWRKLVWCDGGGGGGEPLDDPVLRSYARCLAADILCVWRRVSAPRPETLFDLGPPTPTQPPPLSLAAAKELWIFWYGEEPDLAVLVAPELITTDSEQGSWESGLSYECRSLLFKALHNLIERCLLSRDFIRLGKWFVQPYEGLKKDVESSSTHLSFSFAFFVHGESTVCASVDVRQHPPVRKLSRWHLQQAQASSSGLQVILAPFGLAGTLTGHTHKTGDSTLRLLEDWCQFYPLDKVSMSSSENSIVEVIVGGVKMRYPSCYVLVTDMDEPSNGTTLNGNTIVKNDSSTPITLQTPPPSPVPINSLVPQPGPFPVSIEHPASMHKNATAATILPERVWQECVLGGPTNAQHQDRHIPPHDASGQWDFIDPTRRANCTCSKCRKYIGSMAKCKWGNGKGSAPRPGKGVAGRVPFHRRSPVLSEYTADRCPGSYTPQGGPPSYPRTQESMAIPSVGSPASVAPSPLANPHSQPASVPPGDQIMPTLSPNPPTILPSPVEKTQTPDQPPPSAGSVDTSPPNISTEQKLETGISSSVAQVSVPTLKRPVLTSKEYEVALGEEEHSLDLLYDYSSLDAWLNHPVKRFKPDAKENYRNNRIAKGDLYSSSAQNGVLGINNDLNHTGGKSQPPFIKQEIKQEPMDEENVPVLHAVLPHGVKRPGDPYEFEEEGGGAACNMDGFKPRPVGAKEEAKDAKKASGNLFTSEGLQPSYKDLDQIFDNSDDTSGDEALQVQTPPGSNKSSGIHEDTKRLSGHSTCSNMGILRPEELCKMFPTPPSLEHNPIASPCGQIDLPPPDLTDLGIVRVKQEVYPNMGSPMDESIEDWSYVFRPPSACKLVGSSKYAPLTNLPSQNVPAIVIPSHCVYKPSWMQHMEKSITQMSSTSVSQPVTSRPNSVSSNVHQNINPYPSSPLHAGFRPPPPPYELPSPATSTTSSYINKNINSVDPETAPSIQRTPEASSLVVNILLGDTALNIFRDHNFDSCTLCVCNAGPKVVGNIRGADAGVYLLNSTSDRTQCSMVQQPSSPFPSLVGIGQPPPYGGILSPHQPHIPTLDEDLIRCSCGFSAVVNRRLSHRSGLFYEDEMEITGIAEDPSDRKKASLVSFLLQTSTTKLEPSIDREQLDIIPHGILELMREQCVMTQSTANSLYRSSRFHHSSQLMQTYSSTVNVLEFADGNEVTCLALEQSKHSIETLSMCKMEDLQNQRHGKLGHHICVHRWPFLRACGPQCNQDIVRVMKALQPLLQEAIQKKCQTRLWEAPSAVKGPLTWRQFHRLAGRGTDDRCEPQPVPSLIFGHEKDWMSLSPYAVHHWERLLLEPYSYARDVAYIVVAPDNDIVLPRVRSFFKDLSTAYEMCRLGRHSPITKVLRDGILRVGKAAKAKLGNEPVEDWFNLLGESETTDMLKLYAQVCKHHLAPHLQQVPMDRTLLDPPETCTDRPAPSPMPPPSTPDNSTSNQGGSTPSGGDKAPSTPKSDQDSSSDNSSKDISASMMCNTAEPAHDEDERQAPSVIIYMVEPFSFGCDQTDLQRLACLALLRCFQSVLLSVPETIRSNISVQIISQESIMELSKSRDRSRQSDHMRALALSVFSQCRRLLIHTCNVKSLTGFGPAASADLFLKNKEEKNRTPYKLYTPPYILAPIKEKVEPIESFGLPSSEQGCVLYLSYCLSEDQSWLLAVTTDERGEIFETVTINVDIPNRSRRKKASARRFGLQKLMDWALGIMSLSVKSWRLVVGRVGRIGHGELKGWSWLLSRKNLLKASKHLKEICNQCSLIYPTSVPCILSACLVSLEPDSALRLMPDQFTPDERFSQASVNSQLSTPQDVTCTHILVFPTSATTQSSQTAFQEQHINGPELGDEDLFNALHDDMPEGIDGMNDFSDIFNWTEAGTGGGQSPTGSPRREESRPGSPTGCMNGAGRTGSPFPCVPNSRNGEMAEEVGTLLQQPLALGYLVSTAPTGRMPKWFWASCPHLEEVCPAFLKNALHLHSPSIQQSSDDLLQQSAVTSHPLDSQYTTDVLRYVLEGYNALSWLAMDSNTQDRLSCLPVHIQVLVQLYHMTAALL